MSEEGRICPDAEEDIWDALQELEGAEKGRAYYELSNFAYSRGQFHRSLSLAEMARDIFLKLDYCLEGLANSQAIVATSLYALKDVDQAITALKKALEYFVEFSIQGERDIRRRLITWLYEKECFQDAFSFIAENLSYAIYEGQDFEIAIEYSKYGDGLCDLKNHTEAIAKYLLARQSFKELKEVQKVADMDFKIGRCHNHSKNPFESEFFLNRALMVYESSDLKDDIAKTRSQLGRSCSMQNKHQEALGHLEVSRKIVLSEEDINYYALYTIQKNMVEAMRGFGWDVEADVIEKRNAVINEVLEWDKSEVES